MFRLTTLDLNDVPKTEDGKVDYSQDFFGKEANLTVSGQLNAEIMALAFRNVYTDQLSELKTHTQVDMLLNSG